MDMVEIYTIFLNNLTMMKQKVMLQKRNLEADKKSIYDRITWYQDVRNRITHFNNFMFEHQKNKKRLHENIDSFHWNKKKKTKSIVDMKYERVYLSHGWTFFGVDFDTQVGCFCHVVEFIRVIRISKPRINQIMQSKPLHQWFCLKEKNYHWHKVMSEQNIAWSKIAMNDRTTATLFMKKPQSFCSSYSNCIGNYKGPTYHT
ncbi:hypothetical protein LXL04_034031 [Taraxacum kok-saghyz]